jgi:hypothetical protein
MPKDKLFKDGVACLAEGTKLKLGNEVVVLLRDTKVGHNLLRASLVDAIYYSGNASVNYDRLSYETEFKFGEMKIPATVGYTGRGAEVVGPIDIPVVENPPLVEAPEKPKTKKKPTKKKKAKSKAKKKKKRYIYRSAKTGKVVTEKYAKRNPDMTVREEVK